MRGLFIVCAVNVHFMEVKKKIKPLNIIPFPPVYQCHNYFAVFLPVMKCKFFQLHGGYLPMIHSAKRVKKETAVVKPRLKTLNSNLTFQTYTENVIITEVGDY